MRSILCAVVMLRAVAACAPLGLSTSAESGPGDREEVVSANIVFEAGSANISVIQDAVVRGLAHRAAEPGVTAVRVVGHTDTVGSASANQQLSEARAAAVVSALIGHGMDTNLILSSGRGELDPAVATADEVREIRNNRVEVTILK